MPRTLRIVSVEQLIPGNVYRARYCDGIVEFRFVEFTVSAGVILVKGTAGSRQIGFEWLNLRNIQEVGTWKG